MGAYTQHEQNNVNQGENRIRTLVVDDSVRFLQTICSFLETLRTIEVVGTARDGPQSLEQVKALRPDLVLMDINLPGMNGLEATQRLHRLFPTTPVIIVTTYENPEVRSACQASGAHGFLPKSRLRQELPSEIRRIFPSQRA